MGRHIDIYGNKISRDVNVQSKTLLELDARAFIQENNFLFNILIMKSKFGLMI